jgi:ubiquinone/menaquinone biosynthesis C-methylase UbiE
MNTDQAQAYKKEIADLYSRRSLTYDSSAWHVRIAQQLVDFANIAPDSRILDIATGTGMVALYVASKMGPLGSVVGIDISEGMIARAKFKLNTSPINNVHFELGDAEALGFAPNSFDFIFCSSAFIWMTDLPAILSHWKTLLKPNGKVGFHAFSENAFITGVVAQAVLLDYGVNFLMNKPTGTVAKCRILLEQCGFRDIDIKVDNNGTYTSLEEASSSWVDTSHPAPGQYPHPLAVLTPAQLACARSDYENELAKLNTPEGIWNDMTTFYVYGVK